MGHHSKDKKKKKKKHEKKEKKDKSKLSSAEQSLLDQAGVQLISGDDYFNKNAEFRIWLLEKKKISFEKLSSDEARDLFTKKFVKKWNSGSLPARFYKSDIEYADLAPEDRTSYRWSFANDKGDSLAADSLRDRVARDSKSALLASSSTSDRSAAAPRPQRPGSSVPSGRDSGGAGTKRSMDKDNQFDREAAWEQEKKRRKWERKQARERQELALDEVAPRETGREAQRLKKQAKAAYSRRSRDDDLLDDGLDADQLLGGGTGGGVPDDPRKEFRRQQERRQSHRDRKQEHLAEKLSAHQTAEEEKLNHFRALLANQQVQVGPDGTIRGAVRPRE